MKKLPWVIIVLLIASCNDAAPVDKTVVTKDESHKYPVSLVDNKKDFSCGMPVSAGIGDTAHYKGKVYGFCSKECKDAFLAKPDSFLQANKQ
jgi:YHS domain-containing protein